MLKSTYKSETIDTFNDVPTEDLQEVILLAMQMQEAGRLQFNQGQSNEQMRRDAIKTAKELGVNEWYLDQAAKQWQRFREEQAGAKTNDQHAGAKTKRYKILITVVAILFILAAFIAHFIRLYGHV